MRFPFPFNKRFKAILCSDCFQDQGLRMDANSVGLNRKGECPHCRSQSGKKLDAQRIGQLAFRFFVHGTITRGEYGGAPMVQFNTHQETSIDVSSPLDSDARTIADAIGVGFFHYGPRLWMLGEIEPLKDLQDPSRRSLILERIVKEFPNVTFAANRQFFRLRKSPQTPDNPSEYDSPPNEHAGTGRLDVPGRPALYGSEDLEVCIHECRVTAEDEIFVATLVGKNELKFLDLTEILHEDGVTEFESLDIAMHMLFLAGSHAYTITREIAERARSVGFDGILYPSYFSLLRTGAIPFETVYGISNRRIPSLAEYEKSKLVPNLAIFGRPVETGIVKVQCINRLMINRVTYDVSFGPVRV